MPASDSGLRANLDEMVSGSHYSLIVLYHYDRIS
jgi:hypothetical protein